MTTVNSSREAYQFAAEPRLVQSRSKYRGPEEIRLSDFEDIQNDQRIKNNLHQNSRDYVGTKSSKKSLNTVGKNNQYFTKENEDQEELYAMLTDRTIQDESKLIPDYYVDRPPTPEYKPIEAGIDVGTQINDLELFDFLLEVEPILQVLVGKTLGQAQIELREEDERIEEMRHKIRFEKKRNAELMVTQRKEALHLRKQEEKQRREKQHMIEKEAKIITHQKFIAKLLAKHVTFNLSDPSLKILSIQKAIGIEMDNELKKEFLPYLIQNIANGDNEHRIIQNNLQEMLNNIEKHYLTKHATAVKIEVDRIQKIIDDEEAERKRKDVEQKRRRERRRKLRLFVSKEALLESIETTIIPKFVEVGNPFVADITDIFPTGKESIATIGGLLGELWLIFDTLQAEEPQNIQLEQFIKVFINLFVDKCKTKEFTIYLSSHHQNIIQETLDKMSEHLIFFNQNKEKIIEDLTNRLEEINYFQNLGNLCLKNLLDPNVFKQLNKALLFIFFTSIDYKIPEKPNKKDEEAPVENDINTDAEIIKSPEIQDENPIDPDQSLQQEKPSEQIGEIEPQQLDQEEFKLPEITPLEEAMLEAKKRLKLNFVQEWGHTTECDAIIRFRIPLNREINEIPNEEEENNLSEESQESPKEKKIIESPPKVEEVIQEDRNEKLKRLVENDEFIEPFDGTTFEKEKIDFTEQVILKDTPLKIYNTNLIENKRIAQINERGQDELRKELISLIKETIPEWNNTYDENILAKAYVKYKRNERIIMNGLIPNPETIPIFDIENF